MDMSTIVYEKDTLKEIELNIYHLNFFILQRQSDVNVQQIQSYVTHLFTKSLQHAIFVKLRNKIKMHRFKNLSQDSTNY